MLREEDKLFSQVSRLVGRIKHGRSAKDRTGNVEETIQIANQCQSELKEVVRLLDRGVGEYDRLYRSRMILLRRLAEVVVRCEKIGLSRISRDLENILEDEGVERFELRTGEPIPRGKCVVNSIESEMPRPGFIAMVSTPGFAFTDGEVVLPAQVFESVQAVQPGTLGVVLFQSYTQNHGASNLLPHVLLLSRHSENTK